MIPYSQNDRTDRDNKAQVEAGHKPRLLEPHHHSGVRRTPRNILIRTTTGKTHAQLTADSKPKPPTAGQDKQAQLPPTDTNTHTHTHQKQITMKSPESSANRPAVEVPGSCPEAPESAGRENAWSCQNHPQDRVSYQETAATLL